jgi:hypothetical protein
LETRPEWGKDLNNWADKTFGGNEAWDHYGRHVAHGIWHGAQSVINLNPAEFDRSKQQFCRIGGPIGEGKYDPKPQADKK